MEPDAAYAVTVGGVMNISGLQGGGGEAQVLYEAPPVDTTLAVDSLAVDTLGVDSLDVDTLDVDTLGVDTLRVDSLTTDTVVVDTVPAAVDTTGAQNDTAAARDTLRRLSRVTPSAWIRRRPGRR